MKKLLISAMVIGTCALSGCDVPQNRQTSDQQESHQQAALNQQANDVVGMPALKNFSQKKLLAQIMVAMDKAEPTYTYTQSMDGHLVFFCHSFGYPLSAATEFTSPMRPAKASETYEQGNMSLPQADPDGLFHPAATDGTYVLCANPKDPTDVKPIYSEPHLVTTPFSMQ